MKTWERLLILLSVTGTLCEGEGDLKIHCNVMAEKGVQYRRVSWYKVGSSDQLTGLVIRNLLRNITVTYKDENPQYRVEDDWSLFVPEDAVDPVCTTYICSVWPPLGHRSLEAKQNYPTGCLESPEKQKQVALEGQIEKPSDSGSADASFTHLVIGSADASFTHLVMGLAVSMVVIIALVGGVYYCHSSPRKDIFSNSI